MPFFNGSIQPNRMKQILSKAQKYTTVLLVGWFFWW